MSQGELVGAYLDGRISRRTLIRRLVAAGISVGAAVSYAHVLNPERALAQADSDHYPDTSVQLVEDKLNKVANQGKIRVRARLDEDSELHPLRLRLYRVDGHNAPKAYLGTRDINVNGPDTRTITVDLNPDGVEDLQGRNRARIFLSWVGFDVQGRLPNGKDVIVFTD